MFAELIARACSGAIHVVTGARALWIGCAPSSERRVYYGNHASHGDFVLIWSSMPPALRRRCARWPRPSTGSVMACVAT